ncbi:MAG: hypothetical protein OES24_19185 [Acidimicrobiia bacterium]|nr:hypothetical protein [Acidimicrobiia bacterium]
MRMVGFIRAAVSVVALVGLVAGVPWLLVNLAGWPLPTAWPDWGQVWLDVRQFNIDGRWVIETLAAAAWLLWAQVLWALLFEGLNMVNTGRGRVARSAPLTLPVVSVLVSRLVAGVVSITLVSSSPASAGTTGAIGSVLSARSSTVDEVTEGVIDRDVNTPPVPSVGERPATVQVLDDETAWDVAQRVFGDGSRVAELLEHNDISPFDVQAGVRLELPPGVSAPEDQVTVVEGDHLWGISVRRLQEAGVDEPSNAQVAAHVAYMVEANHPDIEDPDLINPDDVFTLPALGHPEPGARHRPEGDPPAALVTDLTPSADLVEPTSDGRGVAAESSPDTAAAPPVAPVAGSTTDESVAGGRDDRDLPVGIVAVGGLGLLTAAVGGIVARNQARRIGGRRPGTTPHFAVPPAAERLIAETSDDEALADLDRALRYLGDKLSVDGVALPDLVGVLVGANDFRLLIATPHNAAPKPFSVERDGLVWSIARPVPPFEVQAALNPYPTLVSVGYAESAQLLIDLEYIGSLNLTGGFADVVDAMATLALQLATSPLADTIDVVCIGFGEELAELERITVVPSIDTIRSTLHDHAAGAAALVEATGDNGPRGRAAGVGDWTPMVVFDPLSELGGESSELIDTAAATAAAGMSAVVHAVDSAALTLELSEGRAAIPSYGVSLDRRSLTRSERTDLSSAVAAVKEPRHTERPDLLSTLETSGAPSPQRGTNAEPPPQPEPEPEPEAPQPHRFLVRLLGPLRVDDADGHPVTFARSATPEFLAYLVHHRDGVEVTGVMNTLWPSTTARRTWIANVYADAVRSLAAATDRGVSLTPRPGADDEYRLSTVVTSDLEQFQSLVSRAVHGPVHQAVELLTDALSLIEGVPYSNITSRWPIAEGYWQEATVMVDEAARCVATLALDQLDDPGLADWAAARGLLASPHSVELHRLRLRAAIALDDGSGATDRGLSPDAVFQHYQAVVMADDHRPEATSRLDPELVELYESYRRSKPDVALSADPDTRQRLLR